MMSRAAGLRSAIGLGAFTKRLAAGGNGLTAVVAVRLGRVWGCEVAVGVQDIVATYNPQQVAFGPADVTLSRRYQGEFVVGSLERTNMAEFVAAVLLQKDFERSHQRVTQSPINRA